MMHRWAEGEARRASWRIRRAQRRTMRVQKRAARWASWGPWGDGCGIDGDLHAPVEDAAMDQAIADMQRTVDALQERVAELEKLATVDDAGSSIEIEKLCDSAR